MKMEEESKEGSSRDLEIGASSRQQFPMTLEPPELRWAFIRKVYSILALQLLFTIAVAVTVITVRPIATFFVSTSVGISLRFVAILIFLIVLWPLYYYSNYHPFNYLLLGIFTISLSLVVGLACAFQTGRVLLESAILTASVVISLTLYTFWAARRGHDFQFLGPFLFGALMILVLSCFIQLFFPMGKISATIYGALGAIIFCGYIIYDTDNLIKRCTYDEYVWAVVALYLDIINLFFCLLTLLRVNG